MLVKYIIIDSAFVYWGSLSLEALIPVKCKKAISTSHCLLNICLPLLHYHPIIPRNLSESLLILTIFKDWTIITIRKLSIFSDLGY